MFETVLIVTFYQYIKTLKMFDVKNTFGFKRRPRFLGGEHNRRLIVANVVTNLSTNVRSTGQTRVKGALDFQLSYCGLNMAPVLFSLDKREIVSAINDYVAPLEV